jgi:hypothetical protein
VWRHPVGEPTLLHILWSPRRSWGPELLTLMPDGTCAVTPSLVSTWVECEVFAEAKQPPHAGCSWTVRRARDTDMVVITLQPSGRQWQEAHFGFLRHAAGKDVALVGTCGLGDAYGLLKQ